MDINFSSWTKESVDHLVECADMSNDEKIKQIENYIKWTGSNSPNSANQYPLINLLVGYYGLVECKQYDQIKKMMSTSYPNDIANQLASMSNSEILASVTLLCFVCNLVKSLPNL